jgi:hypothetical protein
MSNIVQTAQVFGVTAYYHYGEQTTSATGPPVVTVDTSAVRPIPFPQRVQRFSFFPKLNTLDGTSTVTLQKNSADTAVAVTFPAGATTLVTLDGGVSATYAAGDTAAWKVVTGGTTGSLGVDVLGMWCKSTDQPFHLVGCNRNGTGRVGWSGASTDYYDQAYSAGLGGSATSLTDGTGVAPMLCRGAISHLRCAMTANARPSTTVITLMKNSVATAITASIPAGSTTAVTDDVNIVTFGYGDYLKTRVTTGSGVSNSITMTQLNYVMRWESADFTMFGIGSGAVVTVGTYYAPLFIHSTQFSGAYAESQVRFSLPVPLTIVEANFRATGTTDGAVSFRLRNNGANTVVSQSVPAAPTNAGFTILNTPITFNAGAQPNWQLVHAVGGTIGLTTAVFLCRHSWAPKPDGTSRIRVGNGMSRSESAT